MSVVHQFIKDPCRGKTVPHDLASLAALLGHSELADADKPLAMTIAMFEAHVQQQLQVPGWSFFRDLMPAICAWSCQEPLARTPLPLLTRGHAGAVTLSRAHVRCLNANAFLLNIDCPARADLPLPPLPPGEPHNTFGKHSWLRLMLRRGCELSAHKLVCLLAYLYDEHCRCAKVARQGQAAGAGDSGAGARAGQLDEKDDGGVVIERLNVHSMAAVAAPGAGSGGGGGAAALFEGDPGSWRHWSCSNSLLRSSMVRIHTGSMESSSARAFVDFANRYVGYREIIPSMTQEEVLWCVLPEVQPAALLCECMAEDEVVIVRNVHRISDYTGYLHTFRWAGFWTPPPGSGAGGLGGTAPVTAAPVVPPQRRRQDILVMDAAVVQGVGHQFTPGALARDLTKAWISFAACKVQCSGNTDGGVGSAGGTKATGASGGNSHEGAGDGANAISSGNWGCGVFGGHRVLKFMQQLCAVAEANAFRPASAQLRLDFSTFGDEALRQRLQRLVDAIDAAAGAVAAEGSCPQASSGAAAGGSCPEASNGPLAPCGPPQPSDATFGAAGPVSGGRGTKGGVKLTATVGRVCSALEAFGQRYKGNAAAEENEEVLVQWLLDQLAEGKGGKRAQPSCVVA